MPDIMNSSPAMAKQPNGMGDPTQVQQPQQQQMQQQQQMPGAGANFVSQDNVADDRDVAFENAFRDTAYSVFNAKYPDLSAQVVTFKVIKSKIDSGDAVGAFILSMQGESVYVPIIMSDNMLKPMEIFYAKKPDKFLPFNREWLNVIQSSNQQSLGEGVQVPDSLRRDVDISSMIYPPIDGRISMGMDLSEINHLAILENAENTTKEQYKKFIEKDQRHLKFAAEHFGLDALRSALRKLPEKVAHEEFQGELVVFDSNSSVEQIKNVVKNPGFVMQKIAKQGFDYQDSRADLNKVLLHDSRIKLEEPTHSGAYIIYDSDGTYQPAIIISNLESGYDHGLSAVTPMNAAKTPPKNFLVILPSGEWFETSKIISTPTSTEEFKNWNSSAKKIYDVIYGDGKVTTVAKSNVMFIKRDGDIINATIPRYVDITEVTSDKHKKYVHLDPYTANDNGKVWGTKAKRSRSLHEFLHADTNTGKIVKPNNLLTVVPTAFKLLKLGDRLEGHCSMRFLKNPEEVLSFLQYKMNSAGGKKVKLSNLGAGEYAINNRPVGDIKTASVKLARDYNISMDNSLSAFARAESEGHIEFTVLTKTADIFAGTPGTQMTPEAAQQMAGGQAPEMQSQGQVQKPQQPMQQNQIMQTGMNTQDPNLYSLGVLSSLAHNPDILDLLSVYTPVLEKALDSVGRMLLTFWIKGTHAKTSLGEETYFATEESLRSVFKGLGSLMLKLQRQAMATPEQTGS